jgi:gamma-glutamyl-gamma-aminobutyrate hydrolase PuuD
MALVALTASGLREAQLYQRSLEVRGAQTAVVTPKTFESLGAAFAGVSGLVLCGGYDIEPARYGASQGPALEQTFAERDELEISMLHWALELGVPVLGICRGMQLINVAFGGRLIQDLPGHRLTEGGKEDSTVQHQVYVSPGSRLGAIIGAGAFYRVNSMHHQGVREAQRAPTLLASAYHPEDGVIEALESPQHDRILGVQCHIERENEVSKAFLKLWDWMVAWAEHFDESSIGKIGDDIA